MDNKEKLLEIIKDTTISENPYTRERKTVGDVYAHEFVDKIAQNLVEHGVGFSEAEYNNLSARYAELSVYYEELLREKDKVAIERDKLREENKNIRIDEKHYERQCEVLRAKLEIVYLIFGGRNNA